MHYYDGSAEDQCGNTAARPNADHVHSLADIARTVGHPCNWTRGVICHTNSNTSVFVLFIRDCYSLAGKTHQARARPQRHAAHVTHTMNKHLSHWCQHALWQNQAAPSSTALLEYSSPAGRSLLRLLPALTFLALHFIRLSVRPRSSWRHLDCQRCWCSSVGVIIHYCTEFRTAHAAWLAHSCSCPGLAQ